MSRPCHPQDASPELCVPLEVRTGVHRIRVTCAEPPSPSLVPLDGMAEVRMSPVDTGQRWLCFFSAETEFGIVLRAQSLSPLVPKLII